MEMIALYTKNEQSDCGVNIPHNKKRIKSALLNEEIGMKESGNTKKKILVYISITLKTVHKTNRIEGFKNSCPPNVEVNKRA